MLISLFFFTLFILLITYIILAPGNSVRENNFQDKNQLLYSLFMSSAYTLRFLGEWIINPAFFFLGVILLKFNFKHNHLIKLRFLKNPLIVFLILVFPTFICCFGPIWSTGLLGQYRTNNLACYLFIIAYTLVVIVNKKFITEKLKFNLIFKYSHLILIVFLFLWKNQFFMFKEFINGEIYQYDIEMYNRYDLIKVCNEKNIDCYIPAIEHKPKTLFVYSISENQNDWVNKSYQLFFKSGKIIKKE